MNVLIVSPTLPGVDATQEVAAVASGNQVTILSGMVTAAMLENGLTTRQYQVIHFLMHGKTGLLELSDGPVTQEWLTRRMKQQGNLCLIFLNACNSVDIGVSLHDELQKPVIAHTAMVGDEAATRFAQEVYGSIAAGASIHEAYDDARATLRRLYSDYQNTPILLNGVMIDMASFQLEVLRRLSTLEGRVSGISAEAVTTRQSQRTGMFAAIVMILLAQLLEFAVVYLHIFSR